MNNDTQTIIQLHDNPGFWAWAGEAIGTLHETQVPGTFVLLLIMWGLGRELLPWLARAVSNRRADN